MEHPKDDNIEHQQWEYAIVGDITGPFQGGRPEEYWTKLLNECFCKDEDVTDA